MTTYREAQPVPMRRVRVTIEFDSVDALSFLRRACKLWVRDYDGLPANVADGRCPLDGMALYDNIRRVSACEVKP